MQKHLCLSAPLKRVQVFFHEVTLFVHITRHPVKPQRSETHVEGTKARGGQSPVGIPEECTRIHQGQSQLVSTRDSVWLVPVASNATRRSLMLGRISVVLAFGNRRKLLHVGITHVCQSNKWKWRTRVWQNHWIWPCCWFSNSPGIHLHLVAFHPNTPKNSSPCSVFSVRGVFLPNLYNLCVVGWQSRSLENGG